MMITVKDNPINSMSQPINYQTNAIHRPYSTIDYNYHQNPWEKPNYATFDYPYSFEAISSTGGLINKSNTSYPSFDIPSNLNSSTSSFPRRHTESTLPISTSIYSSSTTNHPSSNPFNYSHYQPSALYFGWNHAPSLMRTHSASYRDYPQSSSFPSYHPTHSSISKSFDHRTHARSMPTSSNSYNYPSYPNLIPPIHFPLPPLPSTTASRPKTKGAISATKKRPRLTAQLRSEILKLKANKPTAFAWEIQQILLQNGICTGQTLPQVAVIQRILNESSNTVNIIKNEPISNDHLVLQTILNNQSSAVTICLSPSQSPSLSDNESASECSICLETYRSGQEVSILSCSHEYHSSCIKEWMIKNRSCPMCRKDIHNQPQFVTLLI